MLFCSKFFQPTVRRSYSSHWEKLLKTFEITRTIYWSEQFLKQNVFYLVPGGFWDIIHDNSDNSNWKKNNNRDLQEELKNCFFPESKMFFFCRRWLLVDYFKIVIWQFKILWCKKRTTKCTEMSVQINWIVYFLKSQFEQDKW